MPLSLEVMNRVLPAGFPPWEPRTESEASKADLLGTLDGGEGPYTRGYFWQKHLTEQLRESRSWMSSSLSMLAYPDPLLQQAVGYIEFDVGFAEDEAIQTASRGTGYFFGAILFDHRGGDEGIGPTSRDIVEIDKASAGIPAARIAAADIPHTPHPVGATSSCWAAKKGDNGWISYTVTAKHAVAGLGLGQSVALAGGGFGRLVEFCESSVDAALIKPPYEANSAVRLTIDVDPAIGLGVSFTGAVSAQRSGRITKTWIHPADSDAYDPQRVLFDMTGVNGDSGALVRLDSNGEAVGIYTGVKAGRSTRMGMSQAIWQATDLLKIELFE